MAWITLPYYKNKIKVMLRHCLYKNNKQTSHLMKVGSLKITTYFNVGIRSFLDFCIIGDLLYL